MTTGAMGWISRRGFARLVRLVRRGSRCGSRSLCLIFLEALVVSEESGLARFGWSGEGKESVSRRLKPSLGRGLMSGLKPGPISEARTTARVQKQKLQQEFGSKTTARAIRQTLPKFTRPLHENLLNFHQQNFNRGFWWLKFVRLSATIWPCRHNFAPLARASAFGGLPYGSEPSHR